MTYEEMTVATKKAREEWEVLNRKANELKEEAISFKSELYNTDKYKGMSGIKAFDAEEKAKWREYYSAKGVADEAEKRFRELAKARKEARA